MLAHFRRAGHGEAALDVPKASRSKSNPASADCALHRLELAHPEEQDAAPVGQIKLGPAVDDVLREVSGANGHSELRD